MSTTPETELTTKTTDPDGTVREVVRRVPHLRSIALLAATDCDRDEVMSLTTSRVLDRASEFLRWLDPAHVEKEAGR